MGLINKYGLKATKKEKFIEQAYMQIYARKLSGKVDRLENEIKWKSIQGGNVNEMDR